MKTIIALLAVSLFGIVLNYYVGEVDAEASRDEAKRLKYGERDKPARIPLLERLRREGSL